MSAKDNTTEPELLACPFCDGEPVIYRSMFGLSGVMCKKCRARTIPLKYEKSGINRWNNRHG